MLGVYLETMTVVSAMALWDGWILNTVQYDEYRRCIEFVLWLGVGNDKHFRRALAHGTWKRTTNARWIVNYPSSGKRNMHTCTTVYVLIRMNTIFHYLYNVFQQKSQNKEYICECSHCYRRQLCKNGHITRSAHTSKVLSAILRRAPCIPSLLQS